MRDDEKIQQLLEAQGIMVLAVVLSGETPWVTPLAIRDHSGISIFEWDSALAAVHSQAIAEGSNVAITVFLRDNNAQIGYYAKGKAELIEERKPGFGRYRFTATEAWINDETFKKRQLELF